MALDAGTRLGPYEIVSLLGAGGMGEVYRARDTRLERTVAVKILPTVIAADPDLRERFDREARAISQLTHPHICTLFDIGHQDGTAFLVMEYLEGETLASRLARGPLPLDQALPIAIAIAEALAKAHRSGIVHRDLKPGNVMLTKGGAKLLDFGLAKTGPAVAAAGSSGRQLSMPTTPVTLTAQGTILGTFQYMAPEQIEGREADARSDIFAFGVVLYEMLTGRRAFDGATHASLIASILKDDPPPISAVRQRPSSVSGHAHPSTAIAFEAHEQDLERIVQRCLDKDPDERWQSAHDLVAELRWLTTRAAQPSVGPAAASTPRGRRREAAAWALVVALVATSIIGFASRPRGQAVPHTARFLVAPPDRHVTVGTMAFSPDGRRLAFAAREGTGRQSLWIRALDSVGPQRVEGTDGANTPFWSADGQWVGFFARGKLQKIRPGSGTAEVICEAGTGGGASWNADDVILFAPNIENDGLYRVAATGGTPTLVRPIDITRGETNVIWPQFLPDGRSYIVTVGARTAGGLHLGRTDAPTSRLLIPMDWQESMSVVRYVAPGYLLYVAKNRTLMARPFDPGRGDFAGEAVAVGEDVDVHGPGRAAFTAGGGNLAFRRTGAAPQRQPTWMDRGGKVLSVIGAPGPTTTFTLGPDGRRLAIERLDPGRRAIWLVDVLRGTATRFASEWWSSAPVFSPDGSRIAFTSVRDSPPNLYVKAATGAGAEVRLTTSSMQHWPSGWSPDGRFLLYHTFDMKTKWDVWRVPLDGDRKPQPVLNTPYNESNARVSPDGRWIAYESNESGRGEVYVTAFPAAAEKWQISTGGGAAPQWRGDGRELFYREGTKVMAVAVHSGTAFEAALPQTLFDAPHASVYEAARDGQRFLMSVQVSDAEATPTTVVLNWTTELKRP